ncbi:DUF4433 domain-containing protein [Denitratimonas sp. CY0512]|uniref:DUF4433 domain-containing protein n=1 Tax=Denitratimonas sp. CY0512 TaxID=3131940 RepID=UPI00309F2383
MQGLELYRKAYHITHARNLRSIASHGLLSHSRVRSHDINIEDISNPEVQARRAGMADPFHGRCVHDYVPFYLNPRNPMMYCKRYHSQDFALLVLDIEQASDLEPLFTDGNAASGGTLFGKTIATSYRADEVLRADRWNWLPDGKRQRCAEVLLPATIPVEMIEMVVSKNQHVQAYADEVLGLPTVVNPGLFF